MNILGFVFTVILQRHKNFFRNLARMRRAICGIIAIAVSFSDAIGTGYIESAAYDNVVVIPDVHGDYLAALTSLWKAFIDVENVDIDIEEFNQLMSRAGNDVVLSKQPMRTIVVQLGDLIDRGPSTLEVFDLFTRAIPEVIGWKVINLFGNHELGSIPDKMGQYVHPDDNASFHGASQRSRSFQYGGSLFNKMASSFLTMVKLVSPISHLDPLSASTLFVHAGVDFSWFDRRQFPRPLNIDLVNSKVIEWLTHSDKSLRDRNTVGLNESTSPVWTRDFNQLSDADLCGSRLAAILNEFQVARIIVGHSPQKEIRSRCGGRILLIDVYMSRWMQTKTPELSDGHPLALILRIQENGTLMTLESSSTDMVYNMMDETKFFSGSVSPQSVAGFVFPRFKLFKRIAKSAEMVIYFALINGITRGIVQYSLNSDEVAFQTLYNTPTLISGLPELEVCGDQPKNQLRTHLISSHDHIDYKVFRTNGKMTLLELQTRSRFIELPLDVTMQVKRIVNHLHSKKILLGGASELLSKFVINPETLSVELIDFSTVMLATDWLSIVAEQSIITNLPCFGTPHDYDTWKVIGLVPHDIDDEDEEEFVFVDWTDATHSTPFYLEPIE